MKQSRTKFDFIILTTLPHFMTLYYTYNDLLYTTIVTMATVSSICWHLTHESSRTLLYLDYTCASLLAFYETYKSSDKLFILQLNAGLFAINKLMDVVSQYRILKYNKSHCIFHITSCFKTFYIAKMCVLQK